MRFAAINKNDFINGEGVSVSFWTQGCPHKCKGCHNPETWSFFQGQEKEVYEVTKEIIAAIPENNIQRNFSVLGGEPLCNQNVLEVLEILTDVKRAFPNIKTFVWTGYTREELENKYAFEWIVKDIDVLITGRYIQELRDITLKWRGSSNQEILYKGIDY